MSAATARDVQLSVRCGFFFSLYDSAFYLSLLSIFTSGLGHLFFYFPIFRIIRVALDYCGVDFL